MISVLERFCTAFADRDADAVMRLMAHDPEPVVVTSEQPLLRGRDELRSFLSRYVAGATTYSWAWHRREAVVSGAVAWLLAEGVETAASEQGEEQHPYRMTMVLKRYGTRWLLMQVHGSSPH